MTDPRSKSGLKSTKKTRPKTGGSSWRACDPLQKQQTRDTVILQPFPGHVKQFFNVVYAITYILYRQTVR